MKKKQNCGFALLPLEIKADSFLKYVKRIPEPKLTTRQKQVTLTWEDVEKKVNFSVGKELDLVCRWFPIVLA